MSYPTSLLVPHDLDPYNPSNNPRTYSITNCESISKWDNMDSRFWHPFRSICSKNDTSSSTNTSDLVRAKHVDSIYISSNLPFSGRGSITVYSIKRKDDPYGK